MTEETKLSMLASPLARCVQDACVTGYAYTLTEDVELPIPPHLAPKCAFRNEWMELAPMEGVDGWCYGWWVLRIFRPYSTDGCTAVPDFSKGATLSRCLYELRHFGARIALRLCGPLIAHWSHDAAYQFAPEIARAWGCSVWAVIRWANRYFAWIMEQCGTPRAQRTLYAAGVAVFGHPFAWYGRQKRMVQGWFKKGKQA